MLVCLSRQHGVGYRSSAGLRQHLRVAGMQVSKGVHKGRSVDASSACCNGPTCQLLQWSCMSAALLHQRQSPGCVSGEEGGAEEGC